ncbi:hypothetical protein CORTU0001_0536 [Corynebacterium tuberculostearicum SK141]|uniref:Uncharacterized protein n=1 Tax=Corynebacterium tuberculostearicum SK141 TaxID=553206 RepID=C6R9H6_9CORY|nr:hypothetical protein CORTU0001_0536 [Corynebacterium tuberculostearicum SK141]
MMRIRYTLVEIRISFDQLHILIQKSNPRMSKEEKVIKGYNYC